MTRAQITVSMTWMFAIIAGIAVFSLIINFALQEQQTAEDMTKNTILQHVSAQLRTAAASANTVTNVTIPPSTVTFTCAGPNDWQTSVIRLDGAQGVADTNYRPVFAPHELTGQELIVWSPMWNMPTPVMNFLHVANAETLFVVDNTSNEDKVSTFLNDFPDAFTTRVIQAGTVGPASGFDNYRYIFFDHPSPPSLNGPVVNIHGTLDNGTVDITRDGFTTTHSYAGKAMLYGAVFAAHPSRYPCNREKATHRLASLATINNARMNTLYKNLTVQARNQCGLTTSDPVQDYINCKPCLEPLSVGNATYHDMRAAAENSQVATVYEHAYTTAGNIVNVTNRLERGSCPEI